VGDADELAIPLVVLVLVLVGTLIVTLVASSFFMIYSAPILFAELLVDGVLSASLYRRLRGLRTRHWLDTALRRTAGPFALTAVIVAAGGWAMAVYAPGAHSIGDVVFQSRQANK
jgi:polyferredoxin